MRFEMSMDQKEVLKAAGFKAASDPIIFEMGINGGTPSVVISMIGFNLVESNNGIKIKGMKFEEALDILKNERAKALNRAMKLFAQG